MLALLFADYELQSRHGHPPSFNPLKLLRSKHPDKATAFYYGLHYDLAIPYTTVSTVEKNVDYYSAGVLAKELIDLGGQGDPSNPHQTCACAVRSDND